ncbi:hypothetical protein [Streptomyces sp. C10-9-1]|uniref:hypothetical protein n=1 Tax=Streptomyces sp. C10-9-1 TaxID=1859285 RepID=UPI003F4A2340
MTPSESTQVAVELAEMRGEIRTGFAELSGRLDLALQRTDQTERAMADQQAATRALAERVDAVEARTDASATHGARLSALERLVWTGVGMAIVGGTCAGWLVSIIAT